jgi:DNA-binding transcriptional regulator YiaG
LAGLIGVNVATVKKWERGDVRMGKKSWDKLMDIEKT